MLEVIAVRRGHGSHTEGNRERADATSPPEQSRLGWGTLAANCTVEEPRTQSSRVKNEQVRDPMEIPSLDRIKRRSPVFWVIAVVLILLNIWYDYYNPLGIVFALNNI